VPEPEPEPELEPELEPEPEVEPPVEPDAPPEPAAPEPVAEAVPEAVAEPPEADDAPPMADEWDEPTPEPVVEPVLEAADESPLAPEPVAPEPVASPSQPPARCPRCRAKLTQGGPVCRLCGYKFDQEAAAPAPTARGERPTQEVKLGREPSVGYLVSVSSVDGRETVKMPIRPGRSTLGRGRCDLPFPEDDLLSPHHLVIDAAAGGGTRLIAEDSRNGTYLRMTDQVKLDHGDLFRVGQQLLRFEELERLDPVVEERDPPTTILGSPGGPKAWGRLTQVVSEQLTGSSFLLTSENVFLGRERGNITFPGDRYISGTHAVITRKTDGTYLRDVGSSNGTYVQLKGEMEVVSGQYFLAGRQLFKLHLE